MSKALVFSAVLAVVVSAVAASTFSAPSSRATYLGYNATFCRGLNFTLAYPGNCSAFYQCQGNNLWLNTCQYPLLYNHVNGWCDNAWNVRCNRSSISAGKSAAAVPAPSPRATYLGYNATFCRGLNFTMAVPINCSAFYQCQGNNLWLNNCQYPLMYNHLNGYCDHAWNVRCNRASSKSVAAPSAKSDRILYPPVNQCAHMVNCFISPCQFAKCDNVPQAKCFSDYCGGCNARWFKINVGQSALPVYEEVTHACRG